MRGCEAVVGLMEQVGVEVVFGVCGDTSLPLYEAFSKSGSQLTHVLTRDERSASFMADAYARLSGRVGVCEGPSGGGVTYIAPGVAEANLSSVPLLAITTDIDIRQRGRGTLTEMDQSAFFQSITKWTKTPSHGEEIPWSIREAFRQAVSGHMGAVHLGLPYNTQLDEVRDRDVYIDPKYSRYPADRTAPDLEPVRKLARRLIESRKPVIIAGAGVIRSRAWGELTTLAEWLGCPVGTSISGKGAMAETHPYALGVVGSNGGLSHRHDTIREADLVFYVGCRAGSVTTEKWTLPEDRSKDIIQLDVNPAHIGLNYQVADGMTADAKLGLAALVEEVSKLLKGSPQTKFDPAILEEKRLDTMARRPEFESDLLPVRPERAVAELIKVLPPDPVIITDPGTPTPYMAAFYRLPQPGRHFIAPRAHGGLGYSLPAVVGAHFAHPDRKIIGMMGDGSFAFSMGEMETIVRLNLPVTLIVFKNASFGWVKAGQRVLGENYFGVDFSSIDHARIARAFGLTAWQVEKVEDLAPAFDQALQHQGPSLVEVAVQPLHEANAPVSKWVA